MDKYTNTRISAYVHMYIYAHIHKNSHIRSHIHLFIAMYCVTACCPSLFFFHRNVTREHTSNGFSLHFASFFFLYPPLARSFFLFSHSRRLYVSLFRGALLVTFVKLRFLSSPAESEAHSWHADLRLIHVFRERV